MHWVLELYVTFLYFHIIYNEIPIKIVVNEELPEQIKLYEWKLDGSQRKAFIILIQYSKNDSILGFISFGGFNH